MKRGVGRNVVTPGSARDFGSLLRRSRRAAELTQEALAEQAGLSVRGIQDLERGISQTPRSATVERLADGLGLTGEDRAQFVLAAGGLARVQTARVHPRLVSPAGLVPLVGRQAELALLDHVLTGESSAATPPPLLLLAGAPGIGKTRLLQAAAQRAVERSWTVLSGGCHRRGGQEPYAPLIDALARHLEAQPPARLDADLQGCAWLVRLLPELEGVLEALPAAPVTSEQERRLVVAAVARVLTHIAGPAGTLLVLDDLQWAGPDALDLLATLIRNPAVPLRIVGGYRDTEVRPESDLAVLLGDLAHAGLVRQQALGPLDDAEAATLLGDLLVGSSGADPTVMERVLRRAGGAPFFLVSYAQGLAAGSGERVPWDLAQGVRQRVALLPGAAREVLRAAAIAGRWVARPLLLAIVNQSENETLTGLEEACRARLLVEQGEGAYVFAHDVIREVVEAEIGAAQRAVLHWRVAEALEHGAATASPELLAYHYARSDDHDKAVSYLERAGDRARDQGAHGAAEQHYRELLDRLDTWGRFPDAVRIREKLGGVLSPAGRYDEATWVLEATLPVFRASGDTESLVRVTVRIGWTHARLGNARAGIAIITPLLRSLEGSDAPHLLAPLYAALGQLLFTAGEYRGCLAVAERTAELAREIGDDRSGVLAHAQRMNVLQMLGRLNDALRVSEEVFPRAETALDADSLPRAYRDLSCIHALRGDVAAARTAIARALPLAQQLADPAQLALTYSLQSWPAIISGDWSAARHSLDHALDSIRQTERSWYAPYTRIFLARLFLAKAAWEVAATVGDEALALTEGCGDLQAVRWTTPTRAELDIRQGQPEAAVARLEPLRDRPGLEECDVTTFLPVLAWAHLDLGHIDEASILVDQALIRARREGMRPTLVEALRIRALVALQEDRWADAGRDLEEALVLARAIPYPYGEAQILQLDAKRLAALGERTAAAERLGEALTIFRTLGANRDVSAVEGVLAGLD